MPTTNNRPTTQAGISMVTNAAGDVTNLLGKAIAYDAAGRVNQVTAVPPCPTGLNCLGQQTTLSRYNGHNQRYLRENTSGQSIFTYGPDGYSLLSETTQRLIGATTVSATTETIYLPNASGPMPVVAIINGEPFAVYADHLNTPRRLTDAQGRPRWQWAFSGFGERAAQSIPVAGKPTINYSLRYPGQVDDGNGLFYNFNRFYDPLAGRYTNADPIGLEGGWNRFGYVGGNAISNADPYGLWAVNYDFFFGFGWGMSFGYDEETCQPFVSARAGVGANFSAAYAPNATRDGRRSYRGAGSTFGMYALGGAFFGAAGVGGGGEGKVNAGTDYGPGKKPYPGADFAGQFGWEPGGKTGGGLGGSAGFEGSYYGKSNCGCKSQ